MHTQTRTGDFDSVLISLKGRESRLRAKASALREVLWTPTWEEKSPEDASRFLFPSLQNLALVLSLQHRESVSERMQRSTHSQAWIYEFSVGNPTFLQPFEIGVTGQQQTFRCLQSTVSHTLMGSHICITTRPRGEVKRVSADEVTLCQTPAQSARRWRVDSPMDTPLKLSFSSQ